MRYFHISHADPSIILTQGLLPLSRSENQPFGVYVNEVEDGEWGQRELKDYVNRFALLVIGGKRDIQKCLWLYEIINTYKWQPDTTNSQIGGGMARFVPHGILPENIRLLRSHPISFPLFYMEFMTINAKSFCAVDSSLHADMYGIVLKHIDRLTGHNEVDYLIAQRAMQCMRDRFYERTLEVEKRVEAMAKAQGVEIPPFDWVALESLRYGGPGNMPPAEGVPQKISAAEATRIRANPPDRDPLPKLAPEA